MKKRVLVIGDLMLDVRRFGSSTRTSPEDPRCKVLKLEKTVYELGGAANVARWLAACPDMDVHFMGHIGTDDAGQKAHRLCLMAGVKPLPIYCETTTVKERICLLTQSETVVEQLVRVDQDTPHQMNVNDLICAQRRINNHAWDGIVVADYGKGVFDGPFGAQLRAMVSARRTITVVNAKDPDRWSALPLNYLICNDKEALKVWGSLSDHEIVQECLATYFVRTRGENGVSMTGKGDRSFHHHHSMVRKVVDVTGAGDAFTAGFASYLIQEGCRYPGQQQNALERGSVWAALCCQQIGCGDPPKASPSESRDTMVRTNSWNKVENLTYNGQNIYRDQIGNELAYESLDAEVRLVSLPAHVEEVIRLQL